MVDRLIIMKDGVDVSDDIDLRNGKSNPFGWSSHELWHARGEPYPGAVDAERIGTFYCGEPRGLADGYSFKIVSDAQ